MMKIAKRLISSINMNKSMLYILLLQSFILIFVISAFKAAKFTISIKEDFYLTGKSEEDYRELHKLGLSCLNQSNSPYGYHDIPFHTVKERNDEYKRLLKLTVEARKYPTHSWLGYNGPWIEDVWISTFCCDKSIEEFGPYIPVFVPWVNIYKKDKHNYQKLVKPYLDMLKPDFLYITVAHSDYGIEGCVSTWDAVPPNLLIISPSGKGHVPIFLHTAEQKVVDPLPRNNTILFIGRFKRHKRIKIVRTFQKYFKNNISVFTQKVDDWMSLYRSFDLILSPRGNARGCFRSTEILQMGLIPILAFDDFLWVPYLNSSFPWKDIGFYLLSKNVKEFVHVVNKLTPERIKFMRETIKKYRNSHFTMNGTINQIRLFMKYGFKKSDLRCDHYYPTN